MELFKDINVDWVGKRWALIGFSAVLILAGVASLIIKRGPRLGIDFTGGAVVYLKFQKEPDLKKLRQVLPNAQIQRFDAAEKHQVQIRLELESDNQQATVGEGKTLKDLRNVFDGQQVNSGLTDLNNIAASKLPQALRDLDPLGIKNNKSEEGLTQAYSDLADKILRTRDARGVFHDFNEVKTSASELTDAAMANLQKGFYLGSFRSIGLERVEPVVGKDLQERAIYAIIYSVLAMLVYIGWRFKQKNFMKDGLIYGLGAIIALIHDVLITVGLFSLTNKEISLTVIAALLTLIGYSVNDTIVIFDRIRENLKLMRKERFAAIINKSINQTMARTILTSFTVFLSVGCLLIFGGEVLNGFSFALTVGIIVGSYSTIAIAAPILVFWENVLERNRVRA